MALTLNLAVLLSGFFMLAESKIFMCYVNQASVYRPGEGKFRINTIDPFMCTHIIYSFATVNDSHQVESSDKWADSREGENNIGRLVRLKMSNPNLKILSSVGGWTTGSKKFSDIAKSKDLTQTFIDSAIKFIEFHKLDGMEIDWQFPGQRDGDREFDKDNFPVMLKDLQTEFKKKGKILCARLLARKYAVTAGYDLPKINEAVDFVTMKSYEYHGTWETEAKPYAPLKSDDQDSVESSTDYFLEEGIEPGKLLLGLSAGGSAYALEIAKRGSNFGSKVIGGFKGPWVSQDGFMSFNEVCWALTRSRLWQHGWDDLSSTPWAINGRNFVSYEDVQSIDAKLDFVKSKGLAGATLHALDMDDFGGICYQTPYPIATAIRTRLDINPMTAAEEPSTSTTTGQTVVFNGVFNEDK